MQLQSNKKSLNLTMCYCHQDKSNSTTSSTTTSRTASCSENSSLKIGETTICLEDYDEKYLPPLTIRVGGSSKIASTCSSLSVSLLKSGQYSRPVQNLRLSTSFVSNRQKHIPGDYVSVVNSFGINIGQILGDGVKLNMEEKIENVEICISINTQPDIEYFPEYDIGIGDNKDQVQPLYTQQQSLERMKEISESGRICATMKLIESGMSFFPISRVKSPESVSAELTSSDKGLLYWIASCYTIVFIFGMFVFLKSPLHKSNSISTIREALLAAASAIRMIYFFLLATSVFSSTSQEDSIEHVLIELPTFFYMSVASHLILSFIVSLRLEIIGKNKFLLIFLGVNMMMIYPIFIIIIILYSVLNSSESSYSLITSCGGRLFTYTNNNEYVRIIRIVYRVSVTFISFLMSFILIASGWKLKLFIESTLVSHAGRHQQKIKTIFLVSLVIGSGLFLNSLAFLIYFAINESSPWFLLALFFTEVLPWGYVLHFIFQEKRGLLPDTSHSSSNPNPKAIRTSTGTSTI
eukprot:TRINITY_DN5182_c0_g1_i1.p1 TRINITY_DN5182_c0_g1~~TRINITY_DN5182_c0_g1_i1.p1  ORF type:complete len:522 (+),score=134.16 TRINITY_DN5182_c0_g1_i1:789-2354(+)